MKRILFALSVLMIASCASGPNHPTLQKAELPELVPLRHYFLNTDDNWYYRISPNGQYLAWLAVDDKRVTVFF